jgi:hypothetical protein
LLSDPPSLSTNVIVVFVRPNFEGAGRRESVGRVSQYCEKSPAETDVFYDTSRLPHQRRQYAALMPMRGSSSC